MRLRLLLTATALSAVLITAPALAQTVSPALTAPVSTPTADQAAAPAAAAPVVKKHKHKQKKTAHTTGYYDMKEDADSIAFDVNDPWQGFNHPIMDFNIFFDRHVFKPLISGYDYVVPRGFRRAFSNFLSNLTEPLNTVHGILRLNPNVAFTSLWRFILNTTFGLGGIHDFAQESTGLHEMPQNLGKTLGHWGVPSGPYVVLPIIGPSSARDTTGKIGDWFIDPVGWVEDDALIEVSQAVADGIVTRDNNNDLIDTLYYNSLDPYTATRSAYRQHEVFEDKSKE